MQECNAIAHATRQRRSRPNCCRSGTRLLIVGMRWVHRPKPAALQSNGSEHCNVVKEFLRAEIQIVAAADAVLRKLEYPVMKRHESDPCSECQVPQRLTWRGTPLHAPALASRHRFAAGAHLCITDSLVCEAKHVLQHAQLHYHAS
eukprot:5371132-Amphidinium_carterae.1